MHLTSNPKIAYEEEVGETGDLDVAMGSNKSCAAGSAASTSAAVSNGLEVTNVMHLTSNPEIAHEEEVGEDNVINEPLKVRSPMSDSSNISIIGTFDVELDEDSGQGTAPNGNNDVSIPFSTKVAHDVPSMSALAIEEVTSTSAGRSRQSNAPDSSFSVPNPTVTEVISKETIDSDNSMGLTRSCDKRKRISAKVSKVNLLFNILQNVEIDDECIEEQLFGKNSEHPGDQDMDDIQVNEVEEEKRRKFGVLVLVTISILKFKEISQRKQKLSSISFRQSS